MALCWIAIEDNGEAGLDSSPIFVFAARLLAGVGEMPQPSPPGLSRSCLFGQMSECLFLENYMYKMLERMASEASKMIVCSQLL